MFQIALTPPDPGTPLPGLRSPLPRATRRIRDRRLPPLHLPRPVRRAPRLGLPLSFSRRVVPCVSSKPSESIGRSRTNSEFEFEFEFHVDVDVEVEVEVEVEFEFEFEFEFDV